MTQDPDLKLGLDYWDTQEATINGVLGGFGNGSLPRVESLGSRQFLMSMRSDLCRVPCVLRRLDAPSLDAPRRRVRALDVGAGIGRVTASVLLPLVDDVVLVEPAEHFISRAVQDSSKWKGIPNLTKSVTFVRSPLQSFDPAIVPRGHRAGRSYNPSEPETGYDVIWCQWCLGHLTDDDLISFFKRSQAVLREPEDPQRPQGAGVIIVKENTTEDDEGGDPVTVYADDDSSVTRSDAAWKLVFKRAGLMLMKEEVQKGLPEGLLEVKT
ncbi:AdoMet-dependent proline di-methyltransferase [Ceratobasidium sp. AG-Ba]|nr:AdoMet-dependent proline di-methyltransferase [Ceratobasidium sp. AG-Ba]QRW14521.1 AdoMet-dependent proline di-methyltransferase [Ceratobasidium sp. AG-Ba]